MKKILLLPVIQLLLSVSFAQSNSEQSIQDSIIGWWDNPHFDNQLKPDNTVLQKKKIAIVDKFVEWMKKSYTPVGGLGTFTRYVNKNNCSVLFMVWDVSFKKEWLDAKGRFKPIDEQNTKFRISANTIPGGYGIPFINTPTQYLFTWPPNGYSIKNNPSQETSLSNNSNTGKFLTKVNELSTVYLAPGHKLPVVPVTKGELLQLAEDAVGRQLQAEKEDVENKLSGNIKAQQDAFEYRKKNIEKYRVNIQQLREKHKSTLNDPAVLRIMQPTIYSFEINPDPFIISKYEETSKQYFPVYKIEPVVLEKFKTDQPQWMAISFPYKTKEDGNQLYEMYRAITENFNYDYAYDYFFNPEKVKGKPYKPANEEQLNARLDGYRKKSDGQKSAVATQAGLPANVLFMDDFLNNAEGSKPAGWYFSTYGKHATVTAIKNKPGKWVQLGYNNAFSSTGMKKPLPENFTMEYDLATDEFSTPTGGAAELYLSTYSLNQNGMENKTGKGTSVSVRVTSGNEAGNNNNNYRGAAKIEMHSWPGVNVENNSEGLYYTYNLSEFTNNKRQIHVKLQIKNGVLKLFINEKHVAESTGFKMLYGKPCTSCALPANTKFNTIYWKNTTNDAEKVKVYISNIKLTKE